MSELELLSELNELERKLYEVDLKLDLSLGDKNILELLKTELVTQINYISDLLINIDNKSSKEAHRLLIKQLEAYINEINQTSFQFIHRDQGTILKDYFLGKLAHHLEWFIKGPPSGYFVSPLWYYTYTEQLGINKNKVCLFLENEISLLNALKPINYIHLINYYKEFWKRAAEFVK